MNILYRCLLKLVEVCDKNQVLSMHKYSQKVTKYLGKFCNPKFVATNLLKLLNLVTLFLIYLAPFYFPRAFSQPWFEFHLSGCSHEYKFLHF